MTLCRAVLDVTRVRVALEAKGLRSESIVLSFGFVNECLLLFLDHRPTSLPPIFFFRCFPTWDSLRVKLPQLGAMPLYRHYTLRVPFQHKFMLHTTVLFVGHRRWMVAAAVFLAPNEIIYQRHLIAGRSVWRRRGRLLGLGIGPLRG